MAIEIPADVMSGDLIDAEYYIKAGAPEALVNMAIEGVKKDLWADKRFDYQGSRIEERTDPEDGQTYRFLIVTLSVRAYPREERPDNYQAGIIVPIMILLSVLSGAVLAVVSAVEFKRAMVTYRAAADTNRQTAEIIVNSNLPAPEKKELLKSVVKPPATGPGLIGQLKAGMGGTLFALAVIGGAWALLTLKSKRGRAGYLYRGAEE